LLNDILDMSKIEAGKMERVQPSDVYLASFLEGMVSMMRIKAEEKEISFIYQPDKALPVGILVDEKRLRQVLINLLGNAVKFTEQGHVIFRVTNCPSQGSPPASCRLRFEVEETGIGMTAEQLHKIFHPFEQVGTSEQRMGGTGLGLAITRKFVSLMGSQVQFKSQLGQGSTFWFELSLPVVTSNIKQKENGEGALRGPSKVIAYQGRRQKVLIADDKLHNRLVLRDMLTPLGFDLLEAENGQECVALARQEQPDMILIDLVMPVMSGFDAVKMMRQQAALQTVPIIAISASVFEEHQKESRLVGCDAFLAKPLRLDNLLTLLGSYLDLSWIYADSKPVITSQEERLIAPPQQELERLHQLAMRGNIRRLRKQADYMASLDEQYIPFAKKLRELAQGFKRKQIIALLKQFME
jgi:CheY-like chemotaxis protein